MEVWKDIPNYVGIYMISNLGRIESLERKVKIEMVIELLKDKLKLKKRFEKLEKGE